MIYRIPEIQGAFQLWDKSKMTITKMPFLIDFWRWGFAPLPKINSLLRPVGAPEIFTPVLKHTRDSRSCKLERLYWYNTFVWQPYRCTQA
jgi:hypothetical protein